ncbi:MAG TPA: PilN domain-containing protein [Tepidisphaeraceae bacterium]|nr:PilN domain-containing protein [Tepidisphaeraceae bacterium]
MKHHSINFMPPGLQAAGAYLAVLAVATTTIAMTSRSEPQPAEVSLLKADTDRIAARLEQSRTQLLQQQHELARMQRLINRADPGLFLPLIAQQTREDAILHEVRIEPVHGRLQVEIRGVARSYASASKLVLKLESLELFRSTTLQRTDRDIASGTEAVVFSIVCVLEGE